MAVVRALGVAIGRAVVILKLEQSHGKARRALLRNKVVYIDAPHRLFQQG